MMVLQWGSIVLLTLCVLAMIRHTNPSKVQLSKWFCIWPTACCISAFGISLYVQHFTMQVFCYLLLGIACILLIAYRNYQIIYDGEDFVYRSIWGISHRYIYADIWGLEKKKRLYMKKSSVPLYKSASGRETFLQKAHRRYQSTHQGKRIPQISSISKGMDFSRGNLWGEGDYVFVFAMLYAFFIGIFVFLLFEVGWDWVMFFLFLGAIVLLTLFVIASVYVARHGDTLPRWIVYIFYKPSSLTFKKEK